MLFFPFRGYAGFIPRPVLDSTCSPALSHKKDLSHVFAAATPHGSCLCPAISLSFFSPPPSPLEPFKLGRRQQPFGSQAGRRTNDSRSLFFSTTPYHLPLFPPPPHPLFVVFELDRMPAGRNRVRRETSRTSTPPWFSISVWRISDFLVPLFRLSPCH